jgi:hypothetical protein
MRKHPISILILSLLVAVSVYFAQAEQKKKDTQATTTKNQATTSKSTNKALHEEIVALERQVYEAIKKTDRFGFASRLADDCVIIDDRGYVWYGTSGMTGFDTLKEYSFEDLKTLELGNNLVLLTYILQRKGTYQENRTDFSDHDRVSSIWAKRDGKWLGVFHQETPFKQHTSTRQQSETK